MPRTELTEFHRLIEHKPLSNAVELGTADTLKIILTTQDGKTAKRPHQAFLLLRDAVTGLDISYPFNVKESGKAKIDLVGATVQFCSAAKAAASLLLTTTRHRKTYQRSS